MKKLGIILCLFIVPFYIYSVGISTKNQENQENQEKSISINTTAITIANQYPDYPATPGDIYEIDFLVANKERDKIIAYVDLNYNIDLSFIGNVNVKGLIYSEVVKALKNKISSSYPGSIINVAISSPGIFKVTLIGEVKEAIILEAMGITTLNEVIDNMLTPYASIRDIEIRSEDGTLKIYDLFKFRRFADLKNNPFLKPNDVITIRPYNKIVNISGQVKRPGEYQILDEDSLDTLIRFYGDGFTNFALTKEIALERISNSPDESKVTYYNLETDDLSSIKLENYDSIFIDNKQKYLPYVTVKGAFRIIKPSVPNIERSNEIPIVKDSMGPLTQRIASTNSQILSIKGETKISTLLEMLNVSFDINSDLENAYIERGTKKIPVNLSSILREIYSKDNIVLEDRDVLIIPFKELSVFVSGSINTPGSYPYVPNKTAKYYIALAGSFDKSENLFKSYSITDINGDKIKSDAIIGPQDVIWVNRDNPFSYLSEYNGWITAIVSTMTLTLSLFTTFPQILALIQSF